MQAGHIWRYDSKSGTTTIYRSPSGMPNGITFELKRDMIVVEGADFRRSANSANRVEVWTELHPDNVDLYVAVSSIVNANNGVYVFARMASASGC